MNKDQMKAFDLRLEEVVEEIGSEWDTGDGGNQFDIEEMQTVAVVGIALQLRRLNNLIESIRKEENEKEERNGR